MELKFLFLFKLTYNLNEYLNIIGITLYITEVKWNNILNSELDIKVNIKSTKRLMYFIY